MLQLLRAVADGDIGNYEVSPCGAYSSYMGYIERAHAVDFRIFKWYITDFGKEVLKEVIELEK